MTEQESSQLRPGDKILLDEWNLRYIDGMTYDVATVIDPPLTKHLNGDQMVNYEITIDKDHSLVSRVELLGCEALRVTPRESEHKCTCDFYKTILTTGCRCGGK